ncbi:MAPEG family protein [Thalassotalea sp. PLHSN55]|uniref:MAPEG family protein n=1 Tax=Thalassotalea sp. PLHSN55 TaxID=3435888 RepID=UPI003F8488C3
MPNLVFTGIYASLLGLLFIWLSIAVIRLRFKYKVGIGDGGHEDLSKAIRVHGNFGEYVPITLFLLLIFELNHADAIWVHIFGCMLLAGRALHAFGLNKSIGTSYQRIAGVMLTFSTILLLSLGNIMLLFVQYYY